MLAQLLPTEVVTLEAFEDVVDATLYPEERAHIAKAVLRRQREFTTVRHLARQALADLGVAPVALIPGQRGAPSWPPGVVGSMTHCDGYRAVAVAREHELVSIGIDAEPHLPLPDGVFDLIALPSERTRRDELAARYPRTCWDRLLFCAKESVYKAWFPLTGRFLEFTEAEVTLLADGDPPGAAGGFHAALRVPGPVVAGRTLAGFAGRYLIQDGLIRTAIVVTAAS